eukprot:symbB.v1.2.005487.t1/scaffold320.1/size229511/6
MATEPICIDLDDEGTWRPADLLCELLLPSGEPGVGESVSVGETSIRQITGADGETELSFSAAEVTSGTTVSTAVPSAVFSHLTVESTSRIVLKLQEPVKWQVSADATGVDEVSLVTNEPELHTVLSTLRWWLPHVVVQGTLPQQLENDPVVLRLEGISLTARDIELLGDEQCLNDSVLDFYLKLAVDLVAPPHLKGDLYVASTFFYQKLTAGGVENGEAGWQNVRRWTRALPHGLLGQRFVVVPINEQNIHWWLAVICHARHALEPADEAGLGKAPRIVCLDSAQEPPLKNRTVAFLRGYLWKEWCERHPSAATEEGSLDKVSGLVNLQAIAADVPKQANSFDCGIFIIEYLLHLLRSKTALAGLGLAAHKHWFGQGSVSYRRKRLKWIANLLQHQAKRLGETDVNQLLQEEKVRGAVAMALTELPPKKAHEAPEKAGLTKVKRSAPEEAAICHLG